MSAIIPENMLLSDLLKATGYDCPADLQAKTFAEATAGGSGKTEVDLAVTANGEYTPEEGETFKKVTVNVATLLKAWKADTVVVYTKTAEPTTSDKALVPATTGITKGVIASVAEAFASITIGETVYTRYTDGDLTL